MGHFWKFPVKEISKKLQTPQLPNFNRYTGIHCGTNWLSLVVGEFVVSEIIFNGPWYFYHLKKYVTFTSEKRLVFQKTH